MRDKLEVGGWVIWITVLLLVAGAMIYATYPYLNDMYTRTIRHSYEYTNTKQEVLLKLVADYDQLSVDIASIDSQDIKDAKRAQQSAIVKRLKQEVKMLDSNQVPPSIAQFIQAH